MLIEEAIVIIEPGLYKVDYSSRQDINRHRKGQDCLTPGQMTREAGGRERAKRKHTRTLLGFIS